MCYKKQNLLYPADKLGKLTKHHLRPRSLKGECTESNISYVPEKLHQAWHLLFSNLPPERISQIINEHWLDPGYIMIAIPKEDYEKVQQALLKGNSY